MGESFVSAPFVGAKKNIAAICGLLGVVFATLALKDAWSANKAVARKTNKVTQISAEHATELFSFAPKQLQRWKDFGVGNNMMELPDSALVSRNVNVSIDKAHGEGFLHRGVWVAVIREVALVRPKGVTKREVLLVRRAATLKTCPGAWGLVGEHSHPREGWKDTGLRAVREELSLSGSNVHAKELTLGHSLLVRVYYNDTQRRDLQATKLFSVGLREDQAARIEFDHEVADFTWIELGVLRSWLDARSTKAQLDVEEINQFSLEGGVCSTELRDLMIRTVDLLRQRSTQAVRYLR
mmetsp:Transcript_27959/g.57419  ORF Transcript_27959/g.57419 Transcript_27959/m.57419 type:complete len:296 (+) Transcript_27959:59-946(+)